ncbi:MAG: segregation/condensation protein A [Coriobacteriales bacterium]|nr:segregation/condensation protein A [Coriobacteriales bacterium]
MSYRVKIESFEGPFQLLHELVVRQKIDIGVISVTEVADQYLGYIESMRELDMEVASDFISVAATLLALKAAALLPQEEASYGDELDDLSPAQARDILIDRLIAYKQFKNIAAALAVRYDSEGRMHPRQAGLENEFLNLFPDYLEGVTLHSLARICTDLALRREVFLLEAEHIAAKPIPLEARVDEIQLRLQKAKHQSFSDLLDGSRDPLFLVVNFLAMLELYHRGIVDIEQAEQYGEIEIHYREPGQWAPAAAVEEQAAVDELMQSLQPSSSAQGAEQPGA